MPTGNRRVYFHGFVLLALAPIAGLMIIAPVANPRAMLSLHLACWLSGVVLGMCATAWPHLALSPKVQRWVERGLIVGMWSGFALASLPAFFGTPTVFAGSGTPAAWATFAEEALKPIVVLSLVPALVAMAIGMGRPARA